MWNSPIVCGHTGAQHQGHETLHANSFGSFPEGLPKPHAPRTQATSGDILCQRPKYDGWLPDSSTSPSRASEWHPERVRAHVPSGVSLNGQVSLYGGPPPGPRAGDPWASQRSCEGPSSASPFCDAHAEELTIIGETRPRSQGLSHPGLRSLQSCCSVLFL